VVMAPLGLTACLGEAGFEEENLASVQQEEDTDNGLSWNGLSSNGLSSNGLSSNGLSSNGLVSDVLRTDLLSRQFFKYVVGCALPAGEQITLQFATEEVTFYGELGLAPEWGSDTGSCDATC
jgi:hypothetical protein